MKTLYSIITLLLFCSNSVISQKQLTLGNAIQIGLEKNYGILISRNISEQANLRNTYGMAGALPTIKLGASGFINEDFVESTSTENIQASAEINWTLFNGFAIKANKAQLENSEMLSKGNEMIEIESTIQSIINSYYYVVLQNKMVEIKKTIFEISKDRYEQQKTASELGVGGHYELVLAETDYLNDKTSFLNQELTYKNAIRQLNLLLALPIESEWILSDQLEISSTNYQLSVMKEMMFENNTNLKNQYLNIKAKEIELTTMRSELYPTIGVNASFAIGSNNQGFKNTHFQRPQVGFNISYTLFNGGKIKRNIEIAQLNTLEQELITEQAKLTLEKELYTQFENYILYKELQILEKEKMRSAEVLLTLSNQKFKAGNINSFDYREVQLSYLNSAVSQLNTNLELIFANTELLRLTGGILSVSNK